MKPKAGISAYSDGPFIGKSAAACSVWVLLFLTTAAAAERQTVSGHVPPAVARLQPLGRLPATNELDFAFQLQLRDQPGLHLLLQQQYDKTSTNFHRFLTPQEFTERFGPSVADYQAVIAFAASNHFEVRREVPGRNLLEVSASVAAIESAFHLRMQVYQHPTEAREFHAPDAEPSLELEVPIAAISRLNDFVTPHSRHILTPTLGNVREPQPRGGSYTNGGVSWYMGSDFRNAFAPGVALTGAGQVVGLFELDGYTPGDITAYEAAAGLPAVPIQQVLLGVTNNPDNGDAEVPVDVEMAISMAPGLSKVVMYDGRDVDVILTEMAHPTYGEPLPLQISSSWGNDVDGGTSNCFMRLAAQGQSYFYASGDSGSWPTEPNGPGGTFINGAFPSDIEDFMTQVGGTDLFMNGAGVSWLSERVWGNSGPTGGPYGSTGGVQTTFPIPDYQKPINMAAVGGSTTSRNVPDVAMPSSSILVVYTKTNGVRIFTGVGGTSCAAPLWAAFTALVNQQAAAQGRPPVGFINPAIYEIGNSPLYNSCFHDVYNGNNTWSNTPSLYFAATGYDLCTGWGSPNGAALINALMEYAGPIFVDFNYTGATQNGGYETPFPSMVQGTNAVSNFGTIIIKRAGSSSETMTIAKPMNIRASDGAATIGH